MRIRIFAGIFFISAATLCLEISLTRFFSVSQQYHFAFLVISIAFLGYGSAGSILTLFKNTFSADEEKVLASAAILFSLSIMGSYLICNSIPFDFIKLSWDSTQVFTIFLYYIVLSIPFFFAGLILSFAISRFANKVNTLYFFDLTGAGTGTILVIFIFHFNGDKAVFPFLSFLVLVAAFLFSPQRSKAFKTLIFALMAGVIALSYTAPSWLAFHISPFKALPAALKYPGAEHLLTKWNAISRVDVIDSPATRYAPGLSLLYDRSLPRQLGILTDGGELSAITSRGKPDDSTLDFLSYLPSSLPYFFMDKPHVLVLEPRGGMDILAALHYGAASVKAVEKNPLILGVIERDLAHFPSGVYKDEHVHAISSTPRSALIKEEGNFDLIVFSLADVLGSAGTGQFGIGENYLYTVESFQDALKRLSPKGIASMTLYLLPPPRQEVRLLATWIEALRKTTPDPSQHLIAIRSWGTISFFVKKSPYTAEEIEILKKFSEKCLFDLVHFPGIRPEETNIHNRFEEPLYYNMTRRLLSPQDHENFFREYLFQVTPVPDDRPFFANFFKLDRIKKTFATLGQKWLPFLQGEFLVPLIFVQAIGVSFILIILPVLLCRRKNQFRGPHVPKIFLYFSLIGMSFMFVEITLIQKYILFLGHPLFSTALIIFALLASSGTGSFVSVKLLGKNPRRAVIFPLLLSGVLILLHAWATPLIFRSLIGWGLTPKIFITFFLIFPLGFLMGFPFPTGIRLLEKTETRTIPWAWATNAFSSVVSSIAALMIAFWGGFNLVLTLAAAGYLIAPFLLGFTGHRDKGYA
jgi:hypothetical protein